MDGSGESWGANLHMPESCGRTDGGLRSASVAAPCARRSNDIPAPPFPAKLPWVNVAPLRMDKQRGRPVLVEFWDFCRPARCAPSPTSKAWHERYARGRPARGDRPLPRVRARRGRGRRSARRWRAWRSSTRSASTSASSCGAPTTTRAGRRATCGTATATSPSTTTARAPTPRPSRPSRSCSGSQREPLAPLHPEDEPSALIVAQTPDQPGAYSGPYGAGAVWAVLGGSGELHVNGERVAVDWPGARRLVDAPPPRRGRARPARRRRRRPATRRASRRGWQLRRAERGGARLPPAAARSAARRRTRARPRAPGQ